MKIENRDRMFGIVLAAVFFACFLLFPALGKADEAVEIKTAEDLMKIAEDPSGSYRLVTDIDMRDVEWVPIDFTGSFDGNGYALLNVKVRSTGGKHFTTIDGNRAEYETAFSGFFASLVGARVSNLRLIGLNLSVKTKEPTFAGGIAGYMEDSTISGCEVRGMESVKTSGASFGVGGIAGFGNGTIENSKADMTLVCNDTDIEKKGEQFMGGAYAAGYIDLRGNSIKIDGYDSEHGYVQNGGLVGMYIQYPEDLDYTGFITENSVNGRIRFFEDNEDRRAYCDAFIGEIMSWSFESDDSFSDEAFVADEVFEYDTVLGPHDCKDPEYEETVTEPTEKENGFTEFRCKKCGFTYFADYTVRVGSYVPEEAKAEEPSRAEPATEPPSRAEPEEEPKHGNTGLLIMLIGVVVILIIISGIQIAKKRNDR